ncbi:LSM domain containing protein [Entamoeba histolytica HM-1:IMSS-B]|uniref:U6 snRNA-associated Sm-like protein LSm3, putative n=6 Tax=Entamoeba histolytica TaxID=5759 RepID=C4LSH4_ENTH1|nr:U6 snRNA-associated Sm-like protein LSm3, putative [Entamoeba histolytica HM-1:IMSS]EMD42886.1 U6 snrnaassociated Sm family LSm3 protein [Entamoeba histolytica KU27]EMH74368.1 LSM domain containing protein [Entamoeba histolytica HM-1:IMSS-B]EMS17142.1 U6 snRNA-associated Sm family protein LSm3, putative [Entamoeba histolytica HM-3:IMSS]ENY63461.1 U6 snRNA-associated Sm family protein LSm3, putative [Entamoeba histolytica HM-1:IMSS-A]GAT91378.1 lsm domain containing protein [Entamoeba histol|eukprot:XP_657435.1 U6 snRNA-associated Sm-like protein LSm3, putative [Entamoeba histolytica HM-1:IMSS]
MQKTQIEEPIDLIKLSLDDNVFIKLRGGRKLKGKLRAFDQHLNIILTNVSEMYQEKTRTFPVLYIRGDLVILISPQKE